MKTLLIINSKDRNHGTATNFNIGFIDKIEVNNFRINKIIVPYSWYNIKLQTYIVDGNTHTLNAGSYTINTLISTINTHINPIVAKYDPDTNKITFTSLNPINMTFSYGPGYLGTILGFNTVIPSFPVITSNYTINLNLTNNIYLKSQRLTTYFQSIFNKKKSNVIQTIPVNVNSFNYIVFENQIETNFKCDNSSFQNLDFQLVSDEDEILDLNGQEIIVEIELSSTSPFI